MSDDNIIEFPGGTSQELPAARNELICSASDVLKGVAEVNVQSIVVVGLDEDGRFILFANPRQMSDALMLIKRAELVMIKAEHTEP